MLAGLDRHHQLGADTVIGGNQHRIGEAGCLQVEQAAKAADLHVGTWPARRLHDRLDLLDERIAGIDINACLRVSELVLLARHDLLLRFSAAFALFACTSFARKLATLFDHRLRRVRRPMFRESVRIKVAV